MKSKRIIFTLLLFYSFSLLAKFNQQELNHLLLIYQQRLFSITDANAKYQEAFANYPQDKLYLLFIDKKRLAAPKPAELEKPAHLLFDVAEPGYFDAMNQSFLKLHLFLNKKIDLPLLIDLHDSAVNNVANMKKGLAGSSPKYFLQSSNNYEQAFLELFHSQILYLPQVFIKELRGSLLPANLEEGKVSLKYFPDYLSHEKKFLAYTVERQQNLLMVNMETTPESLNTKLKPILEHYYQSIQQTKTALGRISGIVELLRALEVAHFFPDGNQRTYAFLLLTKLLIENDLPPAILDEPEMFDGYMTVDQMAAAVLAGIGNFLNEGASKNKDLLGQYPNMAHSSWVSPSDYKPYFEQKPAREVINWVRGSLEKDILAIIFDDQLHEIDELGLSPFTKAILIDSLDKVRQLMKRVECTREFGEFNKAEDYTTSQ